LSGCIGNSGARPVIPAHSPEKCWLRVVAACVRGEPPMGGALLMFVGQRFIIAGLTLGSVK
jgi:hypothetical protein